MNALATTQTQPVVTLHDSKPVTTSQAVASFFGKQHKNVVRKIEQLRSECPPDWGTLNFEQTPYIDPQNGQQYQAYEITRDGFTLLAMGFTGKQALQWKIAYIDAFNLMEAAIKKTPRPEQTRKALPNGLTIEQQDSIKMLVKARVEALPKDKHAKAAITCWSALKSKFGVTYKEIPPEQFTDALSLVARLPLEGEYIPKEAPEQGVMLTQMEAFNMHGLLHNVRNMIECWRQVYPSLRAIDSPLAARYYDYFHDSILYVSGMKRVDDECMVVYNRRTSRLR